ncbi:lycopene cyclase family protein [Aquirufa sp. Wall-65K1]
MKAPVTYDLVIIGAGAAGLQLLYETVISSSHNPIHILLIDSGDRSSKSWCFWQNKLAVSFPFLVEKSWSKVAYRYQNGHSKSQLINPLSYNYISSETFFSFFFEEFIPKHSNISHQITQVTDVEKMEDYFLIHTLNGQIFKALKIADSRNTTNGNHAIQQQFYGKFIQFDEDILDDSTATLMDFSLPTTQKRLTVFHYLLPFSSNRALVETTAFSLDPFDRPFFEETWNTYMKQNFAGRSYQVQNIEIGQIPMSLHDSLDQEDKWFKIGIAGGKIKSTTGYAFTKMHQDAISRNANQKIKSNSRFQFYDAILLHIIQNDINQIPSIMDQLFKSNSFLKILTFLDEKTSLWDEVKIFARLDIFLFLKHFLKSRKWT